MRGLSWFSCSLRSCIFSSLDFRVLYLPVIMLQKHRKMPVKASSRQDSKRPICGLETAATGQGVPGRVPSDSGQQDKPQEPDLLSKSSWAQDIISPPWKQRLQSKSKGAAEKGNMGKAQGGCWGRCPSKGSLGPDKPSLTVPHSSLKTPQSKTTTTPDGKPDVTFSSGFETLPK